MSRYKAIKSVLKKYKIPYKVEKYKKGKYEIRDCNNIIVSLGEAKKYSLLVAHYDVFSGSLGINDNTCAVAMLISFADKILRSGFKRPIKILFTDREETGMVGSYKFLYNHADEVESAIVFDIIGYGDEMLIGSRGLGLEFIRRNVDLIEITEFLPSDNIVFNNFKIPTALVTAAPKEDLEYKDGGFKIKALPSFYNSFHNRLLDNKLEVINFDRIAKLRKELVEWILAPK